MKKNPKKLAYALIIALIIGVGLFVYFDEGWFAIEFGDSPETRREFIALLNKHNISHHVETDHLGRVWVVPDQNKRKEYEVVLEEWDKIYWGKTAN